MDRPLEDSPLADYIMRASLIRKEMRRSSASHPVGAWSKKHGEVLRPKKEGWRKKYA